PPGGGPPRARTTAVSAPSNGSASGPLAIRRARSRLASSSNTISFETRTLKPGLWIDVVLTKRIGFDEEVRVFRKKNRKPGVNAAKLRGRTTAYSDQRADASDQAMLPPDIP